MVIFVSAATIAVLMKLGIAYFAAICLFLGFFMVPPLRLKDMKAEGFSGWLLGGIIGTLYIAATVGLIYLVLYAHGCVEPSRYYYRHLHYH
jgi:hypothetical protein